MKHNDKKGNEKSVLNKEICPVKLIINWMVMAIIPEEVI